MSAGAKTRASRRVPVVLTVLGGLAISAAIFGKAHDAEAARIRAEFERQAAALAIAVQRGAEHALASLEAAAALAAAGTGSRDGLSQLAGHTLPADAGVEAIVWLPHSQPKPTLERLGMAEVGPAQGNGALPGRELVAEPAPRAAIGRALKTGRTAATGPIRLQRDGGPGFLTVVPAFRPGPAAGSPPSPVPAVAGLIAAELRVEALVRRALSGLDTDDLQIEIRDAERGERLYPPGPAPSTGDASLGWSLTANVADRGWVISVRAGPSYLARRRSWEWLAWLLTGLALSAAVGLLFVTEERRAARVEQLVRERTGEVHILNQELARRVLEGGAQLEALSRDFSEQLAQKSRTETALREAEEKFRAVSERSLDAILILDGEDGRIVRANPAAEHLLGYPLDALVGRHVSTLFPTEPTPPREVLLDRLRVHGAAFEEQAFQRADGRTIPMDVTATIVPWDGGHAIVATLRDVSERSDALRVLREREEQLRQVQKMEAVGRLAGGVAHEFNNLLMVVSGYAQLLLRRLSAEDPLHKPAEEIRKAADRAAALTRQLLSFGRKQVVQPRVLDANAAVAAAGEMLRRTIGEDIELRTRLDSRPTWVRTDAGQLEQVLVNLALNARDAMPGGGRLTIETALEAAGFDGSPAAGGHVRLSVSDTGAGIPGEIRDKIFDPFFTTKEKGKGTGLGLATVYGIVQQWGGQVRVESEPGQGATFHVLLPTAPAPRDGATEPADPGSLPTGSETILLVEDEPAVRELTREILEASGYTVLEAEDADAAERFCRQPGPIDLLLTDVVMPRVSGRELSLRLGALRPGLKVLFMSGHTDDEILRRGVIEGTAFLQKPFGPDALVRKVRELLDVP